MLKPAGPNQPGLIGQGHCPARTLSRNLVGRGPLVSYPIRADCIRRLLFSQEGVEAFLTRINEQVAFDL
jgi:hypothetical protein